MLTICDKPVYSWVAKINENIVEFRALFPLNIVAFPKEDLNLHIFEPRYIQLVNDALEGNQSFGIPSYVTNKIEFGTDILITKVAKVYDDGRMDIKTKAGKIFRVLRFISPVHGKLYSGGKVEFIETDFSIDFTLQKELINLVNEMYDTLHLDVSIEAHPDISVFDIAHQVGLSKEQEYELLKIKREDLRQAYVINHLEKSIPLLKEIERSKEVIKMNGHFRNYDPINF